jgi:hypothetical protein
MAYSYSRKIRNKKSHHKKTTKTHHKKRNSTKKGGSCGCNRIVGGSPYLSDLSPKTYYAYNSSIQNDPNNHQLSTRMEGVDNLRAMSGGARKSRKNKKQKKIGQKGGLSYSDFSIMNPGVPSNDTPSFLHNVLSTNQLNPNTPVYSPGIKYYV